MTMHKDSTYMWIRGDRDLDDALAMGCHNGLCLSVIGPKELAVDHLH